MDLKNWQDKIKQIQSNIDLNSFIINIASWRPIVLTKRQGLITRYGNSDRVKYCDYRNFNENRDNLVKYGLDYDFEMDFFQNFQKVISTVKLPNLLQFATNENTDFADEVLGSKNVYLSSAVAGDCENVLYSLGVRSNCKNIFSSSIIWNNSENIYSSSGIISGFNIFYSKYILNSDNIWFCTDLIGCSECIMCNGLKNKSYCIGNKEYDKEDYFLEKQKILSQKDNFEQKYMDMISEIQQQDKFIIDCENITNSYYVFNTKNGNNLILAGGIKQSQDIFNVFSCSGGSQDCVNVMGLGSANNVYNSCNIGLSSNVYYSYFLEGCSYCLGCVGLKNKSYCILNKQYTKEERYELIEKIFLQMEEQGIFGEFLPGYLNPFCFNDTIAFLINHNINKIDIVSKGYLWRDEEIKVDIPTDLETLETRNINKYQGFVENGKWDIKSEILKKVIKDEKGNVYRIVNMEYEFLKKFELPLPTLHWMDRIKLGFLN